MKTKLLIEQHFHGCFGIDFNKASVDDILYLSKEILKYGIGGIFPTIVTDSIENTKRAIKNIKEASQKQTLDMAKILGIHLEGIFINPEKKGIHNPKHFLAPTIENYKLIEDDFIKIVTLAPELVVAEQLSSQAAKKLEGKRVRRSEGKLFKDISVCEISMKQQNDNSLPSYPPIFHTSNLMSYLSSQGIKVQAGHCTGGDLTGCSGVTHLFNAMSGITHRGKSTALSALINDDIYTEIIADGVHVSDDALKLLFKTKPLDKIILISDCLPCTKAAKQLGSHAAKLDNGEILQKHHTDKNLSTLQPFNSSTENSLPSYPPALQSSIMQFTFADETIYYDGIKATSKDGTLAGSTTLLPDIIKKLAEKKLFNAEYINNPYKYHNIDLEGSIEWDEDWNIIKINI